MKKTLQEMVTACEKAGFPVPPALQNDPTVVKAIYSVVMPQTKAQLARAEQRDEQRAERDAGII